MSKIQDGIDSATEIQGVGGHGFLTKNWGWQEEKIQYIYMWARWKSVLHRLTGSGGLMFERLLPKSAPFFELLLKQNNLLLNTAKRLEQGFLDLATLDEEYKTIALLEEEADAIYTRITRELSQTFITPIDREDILRINQAQENCIDFLQHLTTRMHVYAFERIRFPSLKLMETLRKMLEFTQIMLIGLSKKQDAHKTKAFRALRSDCEMLLSVGLAELYDRAALHEESTLDLIKWTRAYDRLEQLVEGVVKLAEAIEEAVLKNV
jgi:uncharacterized protein Yka (UPF0111/DUF47 family)